MNPKQYTPDLSFRAYEAGKEYKRKIGLYETVRLNERFYRGDQWYGCDTKSQSLPKPVFNVIRRIVDYLISSVARAEYAVRYTDESLVYRGEEEKELLGRTLEALSESAETIWKNCRMEKKIDTALLNAALSGDGIFYCFWDADRETGQEYRGEIVTDVIDNTSLFVSDMNRADIQSQDYILISGRESAAKLYREAIENGVKREDAAKILPESDYTDGAGALSAFELEDGESAKTTVLLRFWKENGEVWFEKSTKDCVIRRGNTGCRLYPVAYFNWYPTKDSFHGTSPVSGLIPNQKYINRAYAMVMKHMQDTAFSKIVYDKSKIPEWSNEVGEAIAAMGGGNLSDAVSVIGVGQMQSGYMDLIEHAIADTKETLGATETALGDAEANNTSAILALQESAALPLRRVRTALMQAIEDLCNIWADMICAYYHPLRRVVHGKGNARRTECFDFSSLREELLRAEVDIREVNRYSMAASQTLLDQLLKEGYISPAEYLKRLPAGMISDSDGLLRILEEKAPDTMQTKS